MRPRRCTRRASTRSRKRRPRRPSSSSGSDGDGGPRNGPPYPPTLVALWGTRGAPRFSWYQVVVADDLERALATVRGWIDAARRIVVLTGAGISTDSGIADFRGPQGLWTRNPEAEKMATLQHYVADPEVRRRAWSRSTAPRATSCAWTAASVRRWSARWPAYARARPTRRAAAAAAS